MAEDKNSYRNITKAIGLFGGVQVFQIIVGIIRNKIVAILLGPLGMGVSGLITSATQFVASLSGFGLHTSSVRDVSKAHASNDIRKISITVKVLRRLVYLTGLLGTIIVFLFAPLISEISFGSKDYVVEFRLVSIILLIDQICIGQKVLLQGTMNYKYMAKASLIGSVLGLILCVPLYYIWKIKAIVPVLILTSLTNLLLSWYFSKKIKLINVDLSIKETINKGTAMLKLGLAIALTGVINIAQVYIIRLFISNIGTIEDVGLYTAGIAIATQYINVVFSSMGSDYSPRLAAVSDDEHKFNETINRQMKLLITLILPLIIAFIVFIKPITILLYSEKFISITGMIEWIIYGMFFRAISWCISFGFIAKGFSKIFFLNELIATIYMLITTLFGYYFFQFTGVGITFCLNYLLYSIQMIFVGRKYFNYKISKDNKFPIILQIISVSLVIVIMKLMGYTMLRYIVGCVIIIISVIYSFVNLDEMIGIKEWINNKFKR